MDRNFIEKTIQVWQPYCPDRELSAGDAEDIIANMTAFFQALNEWEESESKKES
jgi:hypothetical protein